MQSWLSQCKGVGSSFGNRLDLMTFGVWISIRRSPIQIRVGPCHFALSDCNPPQETQWQWEQTLVTFVQEFWCLSEEMIELIHAFLFTSLSANVPVINAESQLPSDWNLLVHKYSEHIVSFPEPYRPSPKVLVLTMSPNSESNVSFVANIFLQCPTFSPKK